MCGLLVAGSSRGMRTIIVTSPSDGKDERWRTPCRCASIVGEPTRFCDGPLNVEPIDLTGREFLRWGTRHSSRSGKAPKQYGVFVRRREAPDSGRSGSRGRSRGSRRPRPQRANAAGRLERAGRVHAPCGSRRRRRVASNGCNQTHTQADTVSARAGGWLQGHMGAGGISLLCSRSRAVVHVVFEEARIADQAAGVLWGPRATLSAVAIRVPTAPVPARCRPDKWQRISWIAVPVASNRWRR